VWGESVLVCGWCGDATHSGVEVQYTTIQYVQPTISVRTIQYCNRKLDQDPYGDSRDDTLRL
jgi:hypothetical protein